VGKCLEGVQVKLIDEHGHEVPTGEIGELIARNPSIAIGYFKDPRATEEVFSPDGWVRTGDYAIFNKKEYLRIVGRRKDIISRGGMKISAEEIEDLLRTHPNVHDVAIVGMPDPELGEKSCAYVIPLQGQSLSFEEIIAFLRKKNVAYKLPERLEIVSEFPYSAGYKIQKNVLRDDIKRKLEQESKF
jgi:non-ribosomal peptide synthetase component E (peptide arylation enzyme)